MPFKLKVKTDGKETIYERKEVPMMENLIDAMKVQRLEIEMYSDPKHQPTDEQNTKHIQLIAAFAARFWGNGLTSQDILSGVSAEEGLESIQKAIAVTLNILLDDDDDENTEKVKNPKK